MRPFLFLLFLIVAAFAVVAKQNARSTVPNHVLRQMAMSWKKNITNSSKELLHLVDGSQRAAVEIMMHSRVWQEAFLAMDAEILPREIMLPMRDGVKLFTVYWAPEDSVRRPTVIISSPYGPYGTENLALLYLPFGFNILMQNDRATGNSEGNWTFFDKCWFDMADTRAFIKAQNWSDGTVFQMGASADGFETFGALKIPAPEVHGHFLLMTSAIPYYTFFQSGGGCRLAVCSAWLGIMQSFRPNASSYLAQILRHEPYDSFWHERTLANYKYINFPAVHVAGWYDLFLRNSLLTFENYNTLAAPGAVGKQKLIVGPRGHCLFFRASDDQWFPDDFFDIVWGYETSLDLFGAKNRLPHLWKSNSAAANLQTYTLYVMGSRLNTILPTYVGNYWTTLSALPTPTNLTVYFGYNGSLNTSPTSAPTAYRYVYDPRNPVPSLCGNDIPMGGDMCGPCDQRPVENRTDVLLFETAVLQQPLVILGPISASLYVSSNCTDTDFMLKITDVYPSGESVLITDQILRMRWRNVVMTPPAPTYFPPQPIVPNQVYNIAFDTWPFLQVFNKGHKIRAAISSSNSPRFNPTPNNGLLVYQGGPIYAALNTFYTGSSTPSSLVLPTVTLSQVPNNVNLL